MKEHFNVTGMSCSACSSHVEKSVAKLDGVQKVTVNLLANNMTVDFDEEALSSDEICKAVEDAGYKASPSEASKKVMTSSKPAATIDTEIKNMKFRLIISFIFMGILMYIAMGSMINLPQPSIFIGVENAVIFAFTQLLLSLPVIYVNRKYFINGFKMLFKGAPNMDTLIAVGSGASFIYGVFAIYQMAFGQGHGDLERVHQYMHDLYFESSVMILTLITLGKYMETRSKSKTSEAIEKLINLAPKTAIRLTGDTQEEIPAENVRVGDILLIRPGSSIPVDGTVIDGYSSVNESALTGESIPVEKSVDNTVLSASVNGSGILKIRADKVGEDSTLSQIIRLVEEASASKAPIAKLADKVSGIFVPTVMAISAITFIVWYFIVGQTFTFSLSTAIAVLVISCPCALGLATPVAIMVGTGKGASHGILIKSGDALETAHKINTVVLDKTGTITVGKPSVTHILPVAAETTTEHLLKIAASIEKYSEHPLANAILEYAEGNGVEVSEVTDFCAIPGLGIRGQINGYTILAGNPKFMLQEGIDLSHYENEGDQFSSKGETPMYFARNGKLLGIIAVADTIKPMSKIAVDELRHMGIEVVMLTGDNKLTAKAIGQTVGVDHVISDVLPQDKERVIRDLQAAHKTVAMVGDGINDAPALTRADVGIAIGAGMDVAIEAADIVLMKNELTDAVTAIQLSRSVIKNIKENLFWAFFYNIIGIPLAAGVFFTAFALKLNPMIGAAAMSMSSVCVVSNALRLKLFKPKFETQPSHTVIATETMAGSENIILKESECNIMEKTMIIEGMMCPHCSGRVHQVLNEIEGVTATVNLEEKCAKITLSKEVADEVLTKAVTDAGYKVVSLS